MTALLALQFVIHTSPRCDLSTREIAAIECPLTAQGAPHPHTPFADAGSNFPQRRRRAADHVPNQTGGPSGARQPCSRRNAVREYPTVSSSRGSKFTCRLLTDGRPQRSAQVRSGGLIMRAQQSSPLRRNGFQRLCGQHRLLALFVSFGSQALNREESVIAFPTIGIAPESFKYGQKQVDAANKARPRRTQLCIHSGDSYYPALNVAKNRSILKGQARLSRSVAQNKVTGHVGLLVGLRAARRLDFNGLLFPAGHRPRYPRFVAMGVRSERRGLYML